MNTPAPPDPMQRAISEAQRETEDLQAQARARQATAGASARGRRAPWLLLPLALLAAAAWGWLRPPEPTADELRQGRALVLELAARQVEAHIRREGRAPERLDALLPVAAEVRIEPTPQGVRLHLGEPDGSVRTLDLVVQRGARS